MACLVGAVLVGTVLLPFLLPPAVALDPDHPGLPDPERPSDLAPDPAPRSPVAEAPASPLERRPGPDDGASVAEAPAQPDNVSAERSEDDGPMASEPPATGVAARPAVVAAPVAPAAPTHGTDTPLARIAGAVIFVAWVGFRLVPVAAGSRLERDAAREHPVRRRILDHLDRHPGETTMAVAEAAGVGCGRATYHLSILAREQLVRARRIDGRRRFFPTGAPRVPDEDILLRDLARPARYTGRIVQILGRAPGTTLSELSRLLGMSPGQAHYHVAKLDDVGLLYRVKRGRRVRHYLTTAGHSLSARVHNMPEPGGDPVAA